MVVASVVVGASVVGGRVVVGSVMVVVVDVVSAVVVVTDSTARCSASDVEVVSSAENGTTVASV